MMADGGELELIDGVLVENKVSKVSIQRVWIAEVSLGEDLMKPWTPVFSSLRVFQEGGGEVSLPNMTHMRYSKLSHPAAFRQ